MEAGAISEGYRSCAFFAVMLKLPLVLSEVLHA